MPQSRFEVSIPANGQNDNVLSGSAFEFIKDVSQVQFGSTADATGLLETIQSGTDLILEESPPIIRANAFPIVPDDIQMGDVAMPGERLIVRVRNTTAGAIIYRLYISVDEIG